MARSKHNISPAEKKRRKAQALLEADDYTPYAARALSRVLRKLAEGPEVDRREALNLFDQIVEKPQCCTIVTGVGILPSVLDHLVRSDGDERARALYLFARIIREK